MQTSAPSPMKIATMVLFALSCVGLLLFLWLSFGGSIPFQPQGYRFRASFPNAQQLATQADVRIAGVSVGKVVGKALDPKGNRTIATIELDNKYAPIHVDARAILRDKTILGETYIELTPGSRAAPALPDGALLARTNVQPAVQLDQIFDAFDPVTRRAFQVWQQQLAIAVTGNGQNLNNALGNLPEFAADTTDVLRVLDIEHRSLVGLVHDGGTVFSALTQSRSALRNLVTSAGATFATTAANNNALAETIRTLPGFEVETRKTLASLQTFAQNTNPLVEQLIPVAEDLGPTLTAVKQLSPDLQSLFVNLDPLVTASVKGFPAISDVLTGAEPLLGALAPFLGQLNPILGWLSLHQQLISDFISVGAVGVAAKTSAYGGTGLTCGGTPCGHYLRQFSPIGPQTSGLASTRDPNSRGNTYPPSLWLADPLSFTAGGKYPGSFALPSFDCKSTGASGNGSRPASATTQACWVAPTLPGAKPGQIPHLLAAHFPSK
jgi:phospholipid/cholesterol/gamma-HCH transport system substrate-binding protein